MSRWRIVNFLIFMKAYISFKIALRSEFLVIFIQVPLDCLKAIYIAFTFVDIVLGSIYNKSALYNLTCTPIKLSKPFYWMRYSFEVRIISIFFKVSIVFRFILWVKPFRFSVWTTVFHDEFCNLNFSIFFLVLLDLDLKLIFI